LSLQLTWTDRRPILGVLLQGAQAVGRRGKAHLRNMIRKRARFSSMPSLENLKKQAKLVLRWHRTRYYPVAAQIRAVLPRFAGLSDAEVLAAEFKLSDAQEFVARQAGYASWTALKQGVEAMPEQAQPTTQATRPVLSSIAAQLFVTDIKASCDFFVEKLGFVVAFVYGEPPFYAQVRRDRARINLRHVDRPVIDPVLRDRESLLSADIAVDTADEIKQLFLDCQYAGVDFFQTLRHEPWGARNFIVRDPDGNLILFAGPAE
jgi:catechol 2,3-dioxygenase-like lactoylglutathione lyase family enzyme